MARTDTSGSDQQRQGASGQQIERSSESQQRGVARRGAYFPFATAVAPAEMLRMSPFHLMRRITQEMDRVLEEFGGNQRAATQVAAWSPVVEVSERDGQYVVRAELPGVKPDDVTVEITDDAIILAGERKVERDENRGDVHLTERQYGRFSRVIPVPDGADIDNARARVENGVIEITVPLREATSNRRQVPIESGSAASNTGQQNVDQSTSTGSSSTQQSTQEGSTATQSSGTQKAA